MISFSCLILDAMKFFKCVNRLERPLLQITLSVTIPPPHVSLDSMIPALQKWLSLSRGFSAVAVSSAASVGVRLTALIFSNRVSWHFSPAVANSKPSDDALIMLPLPRVFAHSAHNQLQSHS